MSGGVRTLALIALIAALALAATPASASAGIGSTMCGLVGWFSGAAGKVCTVASNPGRVLDAGKKLAGGHLGGAIGALTGSASNTAARVAGAAAVIAGVIGGAQLALRLTVTAIGASTTPDLEAAWFSSSYWRMAAVAALLTVPFLFAAAIQAMLRSDLSLLMRAAFGYLPLGLLAVGIAAPLTALLLAGSDEMSSIVATASGHAGASFLDRVGGLGGLASLASGSLFVSFFIALFTIAGALTLWLELLIRQAAVYVIVLMLPLFFAAMVWPARRIWAVRAIELLVALILSKFAIVAVLALGGVALGHAVVPIGSLLAGTTLVLLAAFSPWAMLRLLPLHELAGAAVGGLRPHAGHPPQAADNRAHATTDAAEDLKAGGAGGADEASEDVAATLPARMRGFAWADATGREDPPPPHAGTGSTTAAKNGSAPSSQEQAAQPLTPTGAAGSGASPPAAADGGMGSNGAPVGSSVDAPVGSSVDAAGPEADAFGIHEPEGDLPDVIQNMSLDAEVLHLGPPMPTGAAAAAHPQPPSDASRLSQPRPPHEPEDGRG
jgi:hypothetical protein